MRGRDRLRALVAGVVLVATVLAGCASIPDSGPVQEGDPITADVPSESASNRAARAATWSATACCRTLPTRCAR